MCSVPEVFSCVLNGPHLIPLTAGWSSGPPEPEIEPDSHLTIPALSRSIEQCLGVPS